MGGILNSYYCDIEIDVMNRIKKNGCPVVIFGAGELGSLVLMRLKKHGIFIKGIAVTDKLNNPEFIDKYGVKVYSEYDKNSNFIISVKDLNGVEEIKRLLNSNGYKNVMTWRDVFGINYFTR